MKVELHLHTRRYSFCARNSPEAMMRGLIEADYDAVFLTEHDQVWQPDELAALRKEFPELRIFPGLELTLDEQHLLILGTTETDWLDMTDEAEILARARRDHFATILAHPFRWAGGDAMLRAGRLPDAIECRSGNQRGPMSLRAQEAADRLSLPAVHADDAHGLTMIGKFWIETARPLDRPGDIRDILLAGEYENRTGE